MLLLESYSPAYLYGPVLLMDYCDNSLAPAGAAAGELSPIFRRAFYSPTQIYGADYETAQQYRAAYGPTLHQGAGYSPTITRRGDYDPTEEAP